jgi:large repetitive protein
VKSPAGTYFSDTSKWYKVTGTYLASGGENWLTLGTFKTGTSVPAFTHVYPTIPNPGVRDWTYLYIDDVSVREIKTSDTVTAIHDTTVCKATGLNIDLVAANGESYQWNTGATSGTVTVNDTGKYWCASRLECGLATDTFYIRYQPYNTLKLGKDTTNCNSQPVAIGTNNVYSTYLWNTGAATNSISASQSGTYILTVSDTCGMQQDTIEVTVQPPTPAPIANDTIICQNSLAPLLSVQGTNIKWYPINGSIGVNQQPFISTRNIGLQTLYLSQTIGKCESPRVAVNVTIKYTPKADIGDFMTICAGSDTLIGMPHPEVSYLWNTNEMICCIKPRQTGKYQLTISNSCGTSTDTAFVEIYPCDECMFIPTAFTPNGDGLNDDYRPIMKCAVDNYKLDIYNRWGELIFRSEDVNKGWNGLYNGNTSDAGAYIYLMEYRSAVTGSRKSLKGNVTLIR